MNEQDPQEKTDRDQRENRYFLFFLNAVDTPNKQNFQH